MTLRLGAFVAPFHRPDGDPGRALRRDLALAEHLDRLGYDEIWFGEHHSGGWETVGAPDLMVAAAARTTRRIRLGTGVISLPYHHPFDVAERIRLLDHLTEGRLLVGVGAGALAEDARMLGIDPARRPELFADRLDAVCELLAGEAPLTREGPGYRLADARLQLPPVRGGAPLYIASTFAGSGLREAARRGCGTLILGLGPDAPAKLRSAEAACAASGHVLRRDKLMLTLNLHVGPSRREAVEAIREEAEREQYDYWNAVIGMPAPDYPRREHVERMVERGLLIASDPAGVIDSLRGLLDSFGPIGGLLVSARDWAGATAAAESWRLLIEEVAPALRTSGRSRGGVPAHEGELVPAE